MKIFEIIPVKELLKSKERLSKVLKPEERSDIVLSMLQDILMATRSSRLDRIVVVGFDPIVQRVAENVGAYFLHDNGGGLNSSLGYATDWCVEGGADAVLILPADIPLITERDVDRIILLSSEKPSIVISPSKDRGTNALLRSPPNAIKTLFGPRSFERHLREARRKGVTVKIYRSPRVSMDIDSLQDLKRLLNVGSGRASHRFLKRIRVDERLKGKCR